MSAAERLTLRLLAPGSGEGALQVISTQYPVWRGLEEISGTPVDSHPRQRR